MKAIVLLGGLGTRLRPLTNDTPKQMLPVCGRPMIEWVCEHLARHGVSEAVLSLGYRADVFTEAYPQGRIGSLAYRVAVEPAPLGTAGALRFAAEAASIDEQFVAVNGDVLTDLDISALVRFHNAASAAATIALQRVPDATPYGLVSTDPSGQVTAFDEKPTTGRSPSVSPPARRGKITGFDEKPTTPAEASPQLADQPTINAGTYVIEPSVLKRISPGRAVSIEREIFPDLAAEGKLYARAEPERARGDALSDSHSDIPDQNRRCTPEQAAARVVGSDTGPAASGGSYWLDTGTPKQYLAANLDVLEGRRAHARIHDGAARPPEIDPSAVIRTSVVGDGCEIAAGAVVQRSVLGAGCRIGVGATVIDSVLASDVIVGAAAEITDFSVLGTAEHVPPGARLRSQRQPADV